MAEAGKAKVIGVGLNKTGTKTLRHCLRQWDYRHQSYDLTAFEHYRAGRFEPLLDWMDRYDSFEDWPWPLIYREVDRRFPDAKFVLTVRDSPDRWYRSLCKMAVRMGPLDEFERHIYGYSMPQGRRQEHIQFYEKHNREVQEYFQDRPGKLLTIDWSAETDSSRLARFLGEVELLEEFPRVNESLPVYDGENLWLAHAHRMAFQSRWWLVAGLQNLKGRIRRSRQA